MKLMNESILVVEDNDVISGLIELQLKENGYLVETQNDGLDALDCVKAKPFDLVILDINLPGMDGLDVCKSIRAFNQWIPIVMLTAKSTEIDKVVGLEIGADDYITKPFSVIELLARIKAQLRKSQHFEEPKINNKVELKFENLLLNEKSRTVLKNKKQVDLTTKEFDLLFFMAKNSQEVFSRQQLLNKVWNLDFQGYEHTVNSHINRLRAKIEDNPASPNHIVTVWGAGYKFSDKPQYTNALLN